MKNSGQRGMNRRQQRLYGQRRRQLGERRELETRNEREQQWTTLVCATSRVDSWWSDGDGDGATEPGRTCSSTSCVRAVAHDDERRATVSYGSTQMDAHEHGGRRWLNTNDSTWTTGSWKTLGMRKTRKEADDTAKDETVGAATTPCDGVEVDGGVGRESGWHCGRQDLLHGTEGSTGSSGPLDSANPTAELTLSFDGQRAGPRNARLAASATSGERTNDRWTKGGGR
ncbi:hypothetical protein PHYSODRAFT_262893 [Phytophthora sojae]|uniref:Uncharacterized protein n=1 Tax=Phytophthora sojae (strain P6497) TaxID=1094619 RepID=G4ZB25_PHYSP|nr:hypothetical protein PHYSODRAFT_262893 [Phytophthora sojae]EGZ21244.1 hypothetical protein PHYSODRAFT_262893 [Phytophthora sojae]|eukprot:XP_009523961.1 hypothetical protein PHYSODRAFT_262893 [Phytophthora sojae]